MNKIYTRLFILGFIIIVSWYSGRDYISFYDKQFETEKLEHIVNQEVSNFSLLDIQKLEKTDFFYTPYKPLLDQITKLIENSKTRVYVEVYMLTEKRIQEALVKAKRKGIDVKVILERNPYNAYNINNKAFDYLKQNSIDIVWSDTKDYSLNHSKMIIIDDEIIISSGNLTYSTFAYNRDFFFFIKDAKLLETVLSVFQNDFSGNKSSFYHPNLVLSPNYSRNKIENMILFSTKSINMYFQYLKDEHMLDLIRQKAKQKVKIEIILSNEAIDDNADNIAELRKLGVNIKFIKNPKIHAKVIVIDEKYLFMGSENFSTYSLDKNREVGLIVSDEISIKKVLDIFKKDISR